MQLGLPRVRKIGNGGSVPISNPSAGPDFKVRKPLPLGGVTTRAYALHQSIGDGITHQFSVICELHFFHQPGFVRTYRLVADR